MFVNKYYWGLKVKALELLKPTHPQYNTIKVDFLNANGAGNVKLADAIGRMRKALLRAAGIDEGVRFHNLGHMFAVTALLNGVDVKTVSSMLGHYSAGFTLDTYTHVAAQMQQAAADKMGGFMENGLPGGGVPERWVAGKQMVRRTRYTSIHIL